MCGITGFWSSTQARPEIAEKMAQKIQHRGPDDAGIWYADGLALAHRRLSILDLSPAGHQPMVSPCGKYVLVYNGEIYNHQELRKELAIAGGAFEWRGHSDTETLLAAIRCWGVESTLQKLNGMYAFALWDAKEKILYLARDRMGEKPLYYGTLGNTFLFGSELSPLSVHPSWIGQINRDALALYMRHNHVPSPYSIYQGIHKLPPAHYIVISNNGTDIGDPQCYWQLGKVAEVRQESYKECIASELIDDLDVLLKDAVKKRMAADVPLGAFLSGGYDSTIITALMQIQSDSPIKTFTIGFNEDRYNEAEYAKEIARYLGTEHTELYVSPQEAMSVIPDLPSIWDEPFSDSSQIPTYLVSKLARNHVTVTLSGDGGDELFFGYSRYLMALQFDRLARMIPDKLRKYLSFFLQNVPINSLNWLGQHVPGRIHHVAIGDRLRKLGDAIGVQDSEAFYHRLMSHSKNPTELVIGATEPNTIFTRRENWPDLAGLKERMMYLDSMAYLPDDILVKVDRASMATSLEARVPLLDHRVVEFSWKIPSEYKYKDGQTKWLLRKILYRYVPKEFMERPKMGFGVPIDQWLKGPLRDWAEELIDKSRLKSEGFLRSEPIRKMWDEHLSGKHRWHYYLWDVLMFQAWLEKANAR